MPLVCCRWWPLQQHGHASKWNKTTWFYGLEFWLTFEPPTLHHLSLHAFHGRCYYSIYGHRRWPYSANWTLFNKVPTISFSHVSPLIWNYRLSLCHPWGLWRGVVTARPRFNWILVANFSLLRVLATRRLYKLNSTIEFDCNTPMPSPTASSFKPLFLMIRLWHHSSYHPIFLWILLLLSFDPLTH